VRSATATYITRRTGTTRLAARKTRSCTSKRGHAGHLGTCVVFVVNVVS
jgi:hypothetical protein